MKKYQSKSFYKSALHALSGLYLAFKTQRNLIKHTVIAFFILLSAFLFRLKGYEFAIIILSNTLVICVELINSVVEFIMDAYYRNKYSRLCKFAKDMSAGAVLFTSLSSALIAVILILPKIIDEIKNYF